MPDILHLFPDTNFFIQCKSLKEIPWREIGQYDEIKIMVVRPVQREIDKHKDAGNGRLGRRARRTSSLFRDIVLEKVNASIINEMSPRVEVIISPTLKQSKDLEDTLSNLAVDDQIVSITYNYKSMHPDDEVRLITHDTGPMATAKVVGVGFIPIPANWLQGPENDSRDKEIIALRNELAEIRKSIPRLEGRFLKALGENGFYPLSNDEIEALLRVIKRKNPKKVEFKKTGYASGTPLYLRVPPSEQQIADYNAEYDLWTEDCSEKLEKIHHYLNEEGRFSEIICEISNNGTKPAEDVLVTFYCEGNFLIRPPKYKPEEEDEGYFRPAPSPPSNLGSMYDLIKNFSEVQTSPINSALFSKAARDDNGFYYKPNRMELAVDRFCLECKQFRHSSDIESFTIELFNYDNDEQINGLIRCRVEASNFPKPIEFYMPICQRISKKSPYEKVLPLLDVE